MPNDTPKDKKCSTQNILLGLGKANIGAQYIASTASWLSTAVNARTFINYFFNGIAKEPITGAIIIGSTLAINLMPYIQQNSSYAKFANKLLFKLQKLPLPKTEKEKSCCKSTFEAWIPAIIKTLFGVAMPLAVTMTDLVGPWGAVAITTAGGITYIVAQRGVFNPNKLPEKSYAQGSIAAIGSSGSMAGPAMSLVSFIEIVSNKNVFISPNRQDPLIQMLYISTFSMGLVLAPPQANAYFRNLVPAEKNENCSNTEYILECIWEFILALTTLPSALFKALGSINGPMVTLALLLQLIFSPEEKPEWITIAALALGGGLAPIIFTQQLTYMIHNRKSEDEPTQTTEESQGLLQDPFKDTGVEMVTIADTKPKSLTLDFDDATIFSEISTSVNSRYSWHNSQTKESTSPAAPKDLIDFSGPSNII